MTLSHPFHRIVACCLFLLVVASASAQEKNIRITFTGWDNTGSAAVALDSVRVRDLATARDTLILSPFILDVRILTGVDGLTTAAPKGLDVSSNFANPFTDNTRFLVTTRGTRALSAALYSVDGRSVTQLTLSVADGSHEFVLHGAALANGVYILRVDNGEAVRSIRLVKQGLRAGGSARIEHSASHAVAPRVTLGKRAIPMPLRCTGFASGWSAAPVEIAPGSDTTVRFAFTHQDRAPKVDAFTADAYAVTSGTAVHYELRVSDADGDLVRTLIDFDGNGVFDDSASVTGATGVSQFTKTWAAVGTHLAHARVRDARGLTADSNCVRAVVVTQASTVPTVDAFTVNAQSGRTSDTMRYSVTVKDAGGDLAKVWIDFDGNGVFDDSSAVTGASATVTFKRVFPAAGSYTAKARVSDSGGLTGNATLAAPVVISQAPPAPVISSFTADKLTHLTEDTVRYTVVWTDGDGNASKVLIDYNGDGTFDDVVQVTGASGSTVIEKIYTTPGSYASKVRVQDADGQTADRNLAAPVVVTQAPPAPVITSINPPSVCFGSPLTIAGQNFGATRGTSYVQFKGGDVAGGTAYHFTATIYSTWTDTGILVHVPTGVKLAGVVYVVVNGHRSNEILFQISPSPTLTTTAVTMISHKAAAGGGNVVTDGGSPVLDRGICWSTAQDPLVTDAKSSGGAGLGTFTCPLTNLLPNTTYYVRAWASNGTCTAYGTAKSFTTSAAPPATVTIGKQVWMGANLDVVTYRNGDTIPEITDANAWKTAKTGAWCYYNNDPAFGGIYGRLYNFYAVSDPRGLAPEGWRVPTDADFDTLLASIGGAVLAGNKLKEAGTVHWSGPNTGATNSTGFTGLPSGYRWFEGLFQFYATHGYFWTSTLSGTDIVVRFLRYNLEDMYKATVTSTYGIPVRCVKE